MSQDPLLLIFSLRQSPSFVDGHDFVDADLTTVPSSCECLSLENSQVTDFGINLLSQLRQLRCLDLDGTTITDVALATVGTLVSLEELWLESTAITDAGVKHLRNLRRLQFLSLEYCDGVSDEAIAELQSALPDLRVH